MTVKVAINGYGTVGRRIADAVACQSDMKVIGVVKTKPTFEARRAIEKGFPVFTNHEKNIQSFRDAGIDVQGTSESLVQDADIVVDATPDGVGIENRKNMYEPSNKTALFQGGEDVEVADVSFNAACNYAKAVGRQFVRVVSCNTTGLCRTLNAIDMLSGVKKVRAVLIRRGPDPGDIKKGPVNAIVPDPVTVPSHHGPDVQTVLPHIDITTTAFKVPTTLMHTHAINAVLNNGATVDDVLDAFEKAPRVMLVKAKEGISSTAHIMEFARDLGRSRSDLNEIAVWRESVNMHDGELFYMQAIHQESDVVPENVDAIRAALQMESDPIRSMIMTDTAMGLKRWW